MPTTKQQYNTVLDDTTDVALWRLCGQWRCKPTEAIRRLLATHPEIITVADGTPAPQSAKHGGNRRPVKPVAELQYESTD